MNRRIPQMIGCLVLSLAVFACEGSKNVPFNEDSGPREASTQPRDGGVQDIWQWIGDATVCGSISRVPELPPFDMLLALERITYYDTDDSTCVTHITNDFDYAVLVWTAGGRDMAVAIKGVGHGATFNSARAAIPRASISAAAATAISSLRGV